MDDYRLIAIEDDQEERVDEEEEVEVEVEVEGEHVEGLIPEGITSHMDANFMPNSGVEDDEDEEEDEEDQDYDDDDEDYEDDDDDDEEEDDHYENGDEDDDYENGYEDEEEVELIPVVMTSPMVSSSIADGRILEAAVGINDGLMDDSNVLESCEGKMGNQESGGGNGGKEELKRSEIDGLYCPVCFEAWTSGGDHQICCLPCGHIYGSSCIKKWLQLRRGSGKCPQCNSLCKLKDVRVLYATQLCVADEELHKRAWSLEAKCAYLEQKVRPSDVSYTGHILTEQFGHIQQELQSIREEQLQIKQCQWELQRSLDEHRDYVRSCLEEFRHYQPVLPP